MGSNRVKGITIELGGDTTGLDKALQGVNNKINSTQKNLKDVERLLKLDPKNTELLRQRFTLLSQEVEQTEDKLTQLKEAEKQVQEQFEKGDIGEEQYNALKREIIETENKLEYMKSAAKDAEKAISGVDEDPIEEVAEAAKKAEENLEDAGKEASNFADYLKAEAIVEGGKAIVETLADIAEESKEYQKIMGSLEVSSEAAGYTAEQTSQSYKQLYGVLADEQAAATTTANLQAIGLSQEELVSLTNMAIGAWAKYGDSIPIDGLAEALNETIKTGQATGSFCDVLNWAGTNEDAFNEKLAECASEAERANLVMQLMASQGLDQVGQAWQENNTALVENNTAQAELQEQIAELGETVMPIFTQITEIVTQALEAFNGLDSSQQMAIISIIAMVAAIGPLMNVLQGLSKLISFIAANPIVLLIAAIVGLVALVATKGDEMQAYLQEFDNFLQNVFATDFTQIFGPILGESLNQFFANVKNIWNSIKTIFDGIINFIRGVFTGDWKRAWNGVTQIFSGIFSGMQAMAKAPLNGIIGVINSVITGINTVIGGLNKIKIDIPDWVPEYGGKEFGFNISKISKIAYLAKGGTLVDGTAVVGENGPEILNVTGGRANVIPLTGDAAAGKGLGELMGLLNTYLPYLAATTPIVLDNGVLVGELTPGINDELGRIAEQENYR